MPKCDFNKVAKQSNFIENALQHGCSPVNWLHIFRTPFPRNTSGWLYLSIVMISVEKLIFKLSVLNLIEIKYFWEKGKNNFTKLV